MPITTKKKTPSKSQKVIHVCSQKENIRRLNEVVIGNGHPEDGLAYIVRGMKEDVGQIRTTVNKAIEDSAKTQQLLEQYKSDEAKYEEGKQAIIKLREKEEKENRERFRSALQLISTILVFLGICVTIYLSVRGREQTDKKIDNLGTPVLSNPRGLYIRPEDSLEVKFWPKDFGGDTTNIN